MDAIDRLPGVTPLESALARLPKVELHCHIEGTMRPSTMLELAQRDGREPPASDPALLYRYDSLDGFLRIFWFGQSCLASAEDWMRLAYESVIDAAADGIVYRESFFTPARHLGAGQDLGDIIDGLEAGLARGLSETGTRVALICDMDRAFGGVAGRQLVEELVRLKRQGRARQVIGVGMDSTERGIDPADYLEAYRAARDGGLRLTAHQGENSPPAAIRYDVETLGVERIDHGLSVLDDPAVVELLAERGVPLTVCPLSNLRIANSISRLEDHPWPRMAEAGLRLTLNSDDPAFIGSSLTDEYLGLAHAFGYGLETLTEVAIAGVDASWLPEDEKSVLRADIAAYAAGRFPTGGADPVS